MTRTVETLLLVLLFRAVAAASEPADSTQENVTVHEVNRTVRLTRDYDAHFTFEAFGEHFHLHLSENANLNSIMKSGFPVLEVSSEGDHQYWHHFNQSGERANLCHDVKSNAAFMVTRTSDLAVYLDGVIYRRTDNIVLRSATHRRPSAEQTHTAYRFKKAKTAYDNHVKRILSGLHQAGRRTTRINPSSNSVNATVEVFVWTDYSFFESFQQLPQAAGMVGEEILQYIVLLMNAADLRYKTGLSKDPSINVSLALTGTLVCKVRHCSRFTEDYRINNTVDNHVALNHLAVELSSTYKSRRFPFRYDFVAALTRLDITDPLGTPIGVAHTDKICSIQDGKSSAIIEDRGAFSSVGTLVHELGHTLGSDHDGWFRASSCSAADGFIMSPLMPLTRSGFYFSPCSIQSMKDNLLLPNASCVFDRPHDHVIQGTMSTIYPGQLYNATEQCRQLYGTTFCLSVGTTLEQICYKMFCWDPVLPNVCSTKTPAAMGTSCGQGKWCIAGVCIHDDRAP